MHETTRVVKRPEKLLPKKRGIRAISPRLRAILDETEDALRRIFGERFLGLVLFGSHARGSAVQGSDIDLVLLLRESEGIRERKHYAEVVADLSLRHDTVISLVPMDIEEFRSGKTPLLLNVRREGIRL
ncbi:MAG: nucleotidyltransferase domain-containing protein [Firmicutes bacterium]|nr:nucleotidyltransferase domain-containing protein [Bacillota bacterium]